MSIESYSHAWDLSVFAGRLGYENGPGPDAQTPGWFPDLTTLGVASADVSASPPQGVA